MSWEQRGEAEEEEDDEESRVLIPKKNIFKVLSFSVY